MQKMITIKVGKVKNKTLITLMIMTMLLMLMLLKLSMQMLILQRLTMLMMTIMMVIMMVLYCCCSFSYLSGHWSIVQYVGKGESGRFELRLRHGSMVLGQVYRWGHHIYVPHR